MLFCGYLRAPTPTTDRSGQGTGVRTGGVFVQLVFAEWRQSDEAHGGGELGTYSQLSTGARTESPKRPTHGGKHSLGTTAPQAARQALNDLEDRAGRHVTNCLAKHYSERVSMAQIQTVGNLTTCPIASRL